MAETLVEKGICASCGSTVRQDSAFCYNCGESVVVEPPPPAILKPPTGTLNGRDPRNDKTLEFHEPEPPPVAVPMLPLETPPPPREVPTDATAKTEKPEALRTFPAARREIRRQSKKTVEVEWVERPPSVARFLIVAIVIALMVGGLIAAAAYLR